ncbi:MAG: hypothetical protein ISP10_05315 [Aeromicrobium sp.]|jgi:hypothetical protein|nr:hypothetical protein [Aeromicrobium sp.]
MNMPVYPQQAPAQRNDPQYIAYLEQRIAALEARLPQTKLVNPSFLSRAFAVWGHHFVAQLLISLVVGFIAFILSLLFAGGVAAIFNSMSNSVYY